MDVFTSLVLSVKVLHPSVRRKVQFAASVIFSLNLSIKILNFSDTRPSSSLPIIGSLTVKSPSFSAKSEILSFSMFMEFIIFFYKCDGQN
ncbi:hypothetical protein A0J52_07215 [Clostridium sporogenes]|nr:hypothetical protein A0J52_07215 [Clostridium sporogenes]